MYSRRPSFVVGFHGCDESVRNEIVTNQSEMKPSCNDYDWLGHGFYFWENDYERALSFAEEQKIRGKITHPAVLGAYIDLGNCLDLLSFRHLKALKETYMQLEEAFALLGKPLPVNNSISTSNDLLIRKLDCAVINAHIKQNVPKFDSVRGVFWEGTDLYPGAGMKEKNHIQICIRDLNCIKGFFIPRKLSATPFFI